MNACSVPARSGRGRYDTFTSCTVNVENLRSNICVISQSRLTVECRSLVIFTLHASSRLKYFYYYLNLNLRVYKSLTPVLLHRLAIIINITSLKSSRTNIFDTQREATSDKLREKVKCIN